ncbi:hypothetical protein J2X11_001469 [Aeromicrobium panaciterrae]|uniref:Multiple inositol polyphosphate phosphatase 1 n=1 Tax=Aeromicrobium panaciterrae TaxID=363861 RepID=A0ABU1UNC9_9ACTN|nr:histidine-type phosphatase [Aeromicrobium panaciterrae]MDR7086630.1 hypothetical protein [Aeromicrobium panaciterrae]
MSKAFKLSAACAVLAVALAGPAHAIPESPYANQTPYLDPAATPLTPPAGYDMVFIETVGRHGSRSMTSNSAETRALKIWNTAKSKGKLTTIGQSFDDDLADFQEAEGVVRYGRLTTIGKAEWTGIGKRTAENYEPFFSSLAPDQIAYVTSTYTRTRQSATAMSAGIKSVIPGLPTYVPKVEDEAKALLELPVGSTSAGRSAIAKIKNSYDVRLAAKHVLRTMYTKSYVDSLDAPVAAALDIYVIYSTGPGMADDTDVTFNDYVPVADAVVLGYVKDAEKFYEYGPGVAGQTNSYRAAKPLLNDFFARLDARVAGGSTAAVFRHGHGETTVPFAALIRVPGSDQHASASSYYTRSNNPWRGRIAALPAGSTEWVAYKKSGSPTLVTMRFNEVPKKFRASCTPTVPNGYFYTVAELKDCLL